MQAGVDRFLCVAAALCGAAGVVFSAVAAHAGGGTLGTAASFLLMHAPAFLAAGLAAAPKPIRLAVWLLFAGLALFAGDLIARHFGMARLFPLAAPIGGTTMIFGWIAIGVAALLPHRS